MRAASRGGVASCVFTWMGGGSRSGSGFERFPLLANKLFQFRKPLKHGLRRIQLIPGIQDLHLHLNQFQLERRSDLGCGHLQERFDRDIGTLRSLGFVVAAKRIDFSKLLVGDFRKIGIEGFHISVNRG